MRHVLPPATPSSCRHRRIRRRNPFCGERLGRVDTANSGVVGVVEAVWLGVGVARLDANVRCVHVLRLVLHRLPHSSGSPADASRNHMAGDGAGPHGNAELAFTTAFRAIRDALRKLHEDVVGVALGVPRRKLLHDTHLHKGLQARQQTSRLIVEIPLIREAFDIVTAFVGLHNATHELQENAIGIPRRVPRSEFIEHLLLKLFRQGDELLLGLLPKRPFRHKLYDSGAGECGHALRHHDRLVQ
mmetsp:Transcript_57780/g.161208  ORF Transcript_57780/g.161208 Transcript_57780/m.161208 type:complete len:244 (+) Transcript_57780:677-1408(+)